MSKNFKKEKLKKLKTDEQKLFEHNYLNKYLNKQSEERKDCRKIDTHSVVFGTISNGIIHVSPREKEEREQNQKKI